jgi:MFS family permease
VRNLLPEIAARAGRLVCFCPPGMPVEGAQARGPVLLSAGFAVSVLAQTVTLGILPLAGLLMAPRAEWAGLPYMAMLIGAAIATFPASFLLDAFGRRASFALGASHGIAGGLVLAWALITHAFIPFCLGAFWLGVAQGFGLFYRHEAAMGGGVMGRSTRLGTAGAVLESCGGGAVGAGTAATGAVLVGSGRGGVTGRSTRLGTAGAVLESGGDGVRVPKCWRGGWMWRQSSKPTFLCEAEYISRCGYSALLMVIL